MTEAELAARLSRDLNSLASEAEWTTTGSGDQPQGSYTDAIADAKAAADVDDLTTATAAQIVSIRRTALLACYDRLVNYYATLVDITVGPRQERLSQLLGAVERARQASVGRVAQGVTIRRGPAVDYTAGGGDDSDA